MADAVILLAVTVVVGLPLAVWAYVTDDTRTTDPTSVQPVHHPKHLRSTR